MREITATGLVIVGCGLVVAGVATIFVPAGLIVAGTACLAVGLFGVNLSDKT